MRRKPVSKARRKEIYEKYDGHCAYCGCPITYQEMQVDHVVPLANGGTNDLQNLNPSCPACNTFKGDKTIKSFRRRIKSLTRKLWLEEPFAQSFNMARRFGIIVEDKTKYPIKFYFEEVHRK